MAINPLYIYPNKTRMRLFFFSGFHFLFLGAVLFHFGLYTLAGVCILGGLLNFFVNFSKAFSNAPALIVSEEGITDNMNFPSLGFIPLENIKEAKLDKVTGMDHILVYLHDPEKHIATQSYFKRSIMRKNLEVIGTCIMFRTNIFPAKKQQVLDLINRLASGF